MVLNSWYCLAYYDCEDIAAFIPLEELLNTDYQPYLKKMNLESEMKLDFTYIVKTLFEHMPDMVEEVEQQLSHYDSKIMYNELHQEDRKEIRTETIVAPIVNRPVSSEVDNNSINFERKVSLPTMPVGLDESDANMVAQHLLELYPTLKKGQAEFYARHCTLGKYYTIGMYKKENDCAYETARTSMDNLASLGFYRKENVRNKFVYTPNPLNRED